MMKDSIKVNSRVNHKVFGDGTIIQRNDSYITVLFDEGATKRFVKESFISTGIIVVKEDTCDNIKISQIIVKNLFGNQINYDIRLNTNNNVAILSAPNGCGKTTIFKILDFIFNPNIKTFSRIKGIPFERFSCVLDNGNKLELCRESLKSVENEDSKGKRTIKYNIAISMLDEEFDFVFSVVKENELVKKISFAETVIEDRKSASSHIYYEHDDDFEELQYAPGTARVGYKRFFALIDSVVRNNNCKVNLDFIVANRLQKSYYPQTVRNNLAQGSYVYGKTYNRDTEKIDFLRYANEEMLLNIKNWLDEYNELSSIAKNKLPAMYIKSKESIEITFEQFKKRWDSYHQELDKFFELGLLERSEALISASDLENAFHKKTSFLLTYLDAYEGTLAPLQSNYDKLKLFADIFNKRNEITGKTIKFTKNGMEIYVKDKKIDINRLSSGEKNDFVMFYWLIFNTEKYGIVLIDEPEISLHIEWQEEYLDRLIEICKMNNLQAIVATHSPNIVSDHFDLFVDKR